MVAAITGFSSSFAIVLAGLAAVGATRSQSASGLLVICVAQGVLSVVLSAAYRVPLKFAWSTPGAALLVATAGVTGRFAEAVAAFIVAGALIVLVGLWPALERLIGRIPRPISNAMLAGILFPLCLAPVKAAVQVPLLAIPVILVWLLLYRLAPRWAVPAAIVLAGILLAVTVDSGWLRGASLLPRLDFVAPVFDPLVVLSLAIPLFIVTMAGQNIPGAAILHNFGYRPPVRAALIGSGLLSGAGALFGGIPINLAALTQALTAGPEAAVDRDRRWIAPVSAGATYIVLGLLAGVATAFVAASPPVLIQAVAGLALLGALVGAVTAAVEDAASRLAAIVAFLVTASGITVAGIGSAFWGLIVGAVVMLWLGWRRRTSRPVDTAPGR
ncbi:benzoate/H(+) symporter BenE family transporter [Lacisediminihabitans profunda]|uniref:benzoate/H(+) symporter BenE family transporter n=1 Tax=Lacisediminihabitans profunda TaxID=2594790 RepID=UPI0024828A63|nr:benzoate/H(+) symporter BenE family transporter [Lacisediminihabitans profunda]